MKDFFEKKNYLTHKEAALEEKDFKAESSNLSSNGSTNVSLKDLGANPLKCNDQKKDLLSPSLSAECEPYLAHVDNLIILTNLSSTVLQYVSTRLHQILKILSLFVSIEFNLSSLLQ